MARQLGPRVLDGCGPCVYTKGMRALKGLWLFCAVLPLLGTSAFAVRPVPIVRPGLGRGSVSQVHSTPPRLIATAPAPLTLPEFKTTLTLHPAPLPETLALPKPEVPSLDRESSRSEPAQPAPDAGRVLFDGSGKGLWKGLKDWLSGVPLKTPVKSINRDQGKFSINGELALEIGFGSFKNVLAPPEDPSLVVKVFRDISSSHGSLDEKRLEVANLITLAPHNAAPRLLQQGAVTLGGKTAGFVVQERVFGSDLRTPDPAKLRLVRALFAKLVKAGVEIGDADTPFKLRQNIMVGKTRSDPVPTAYLIDADFSPSRLSSKELERFYEKLLIVLSRPSP